MENNFDNFIEINAPQTGNQEIREMLEAVDKLDLDSITDILNVFTR